jgi:hypothetical protein
MSGTSRIYQQSNSWKRGGHVSRRIFSFYDGKKKQIASVKKACADRVKLSDELYFEYRRRESLAILKK